MASPLPEGTIILRNVRLSFPNLFRPEGIKGDSSSKPRYGATFLIDKDDKANIKLIGDEIRRLEGAKFKGKTMPDKDICFHDGDQKDFDGYAGCMYLAANRSEKQGRPNVKDRDGKTPLAESDGRPYAGCYVNAVVSFYVPKDWKKICCSLEVVQFAKDGEPFSGSGVVAEDILDDLTDDDDDV